MNKKPLILSLLLITIGIGAIAQNNTFTWGDGMTTYTGTFDTAKYSYNDIETIYHTLHTPSTKILTLGMVWNIEQMDTITTTPIDSFYYQTLHTLETMKIPEGRFWDSLLVCRKRELYESWQHGRLFIRGLKNPSVLLEHSNPNCAPIIKTLSGTDEELLIAWGHLIQRQKRDDMHPEEIEAKYQEHLNSSDRLKYARLEIMTYEWHNCMNQFVYRYENGSFEDFLQVETEFEKLFVHIVVN